MAKFNDKISHTSSVDIFASLELLFSSLLLLFSRTILVIDTALSEHSFITNVNGCSMCMLATEIVKQIIDNREGKSSKWCRLSLKKIRNVVLASIFVGSFNFAWYELIDFHFNSGRFDFINLLKKILLAQFLANPALEALELIAFSYFERKKFRDMASVWRGKFLDKFRVNLMAWPLFYVLNFVAVPRKYRVLVDNTERFIHNSCWRYMKYKQVKLVWQGSHSFVQASPPPQLKFIQVEKKKEVESLSPASAKIKIKDLVSVLQKLHKKPSSISKIPKSFKAKSTNYSLVPTKKRRQNKAERKKNESSSKQNDNLTIESSESKSDDNTTNLLNTGNKESGKEICQVSNNKEMRVFFEKTFDQLSADVSDLNRKLMITLSALAEDMNQVLKCCSVNTKSMKDLKQLFKDIQEEKLNTAVRKPTQSKLSKKSQGSVLVGAISPRLMKKTLKSSSPRITRTATSFAQKYVNKTKF